MSFEAHECVGVGRVLGSGGSETAQIVCNFTLQSLASKADLESRPAALGMSGFPGRTQ